MIETLIPGAILLFIGALGWAAAYEPEFYRKYCYWQLTAVAILITISICIWDSGVTYAESATYRYIATDKSQAAQLALDQLKLPADWVLGSYLVFTTIVFVLRLFSDYRQGKHGGGKDGGS